MGAGKWIEPTARAAKFVAITNEETWDKNNAEEMHMMDHITNLGITDGRQGCGIAVRVHLDLLT